MRHVVGLVLVVVVGFTVGATYARLVGPTAATITVTMLAWIAATAAVYLAHEWLDARLERRRRRAPAPSWYLSRDRWGRR